MPPGGCQLLILQPTPFCNIDCQYCYLPNRTSKERMSDEVIVAAMNRVVESGLVSSEMTIVWHAGEPLVLPPEWYAHAIELIEARTPKGCELTHSIQTNAMLVDDDWCKFIKSHPRVQIGVSVDGPAILHDSRRKTRSGKGTLAQALKGIAKLRENEIPFHAITVLTHASLEFPDELHEFYEENGIERVGFNVEEIEGGHTKSSLLAKDADRRYRAFMRRFLELVDEHRGTPVVREMDMAFGMLQATKMEGEMPRSVAPLPRGGPALERQGAPMRDQQNAPWAIVSVGVDGGFTTFSPELIGVQSKDYGDFMLGNVLRDSFEDATKTPRFLALDGDIEAGVAACKKECPYFDACGGGAPANKYFENGSMRSTETLYCRLTKKALIDVCREFLAARAA